MSNIILQPAGNPAATKHYAETVTRPVPLKSIIDFVTDQEAADLRQIYPSNDCRVWGATPGKDNSKVQRWDRIKVGDVVLFSATGYITATAVVTYKVHNRALATSLWGVDPKGQAWEYMYFLDELQAVKIPFEKINKLAGYASNNTARAFTVLAPEISHRILQAYNLSSQTYFEPIDQEAYNRLQDKMDSLDETDAQVLAKRRLEQGFLTQHLFQHKTIADCAICGKKYPISVLVAAHIKPRRACSVDERKDLDVAIPMCKLGCDELFERGYIGVENGRVIDLGKKPTTPPLQAKVESLTNRTSAYFTPARSAYFQWHVESHRAKQSHLL